VTVGVRSLPSLSSLLFSLAAPGPFFVLANAMPLLLWFCIDDQWFSIALQGYLRAPITGAAVIFWSLYFLSFYLGTRLAKSRISELSVVAPRPVLMARLHVLALTMTLASVVAIANFFVHGGLDALFLLGESNANELKIALYSAGTSVQLSIMARHLILTALITWPFLSHQLARRASLALLVLSVIFLTLFTSSRLTAISAVIVWLLAHDWRTTPLVDKTAYSRRLILSMTFILVLFGIGVATRSVGTWAGLTGSDSVVLNASAEFLAYYVSPINYSTAIVNDFSPGDLGLAALYVLGFIFSVFNVDDPVAIGKLFDSIAPYYNSSLNQIGLLGQFYSGWGVLFVFPLACYGYVAQRLYYFYRRRNAVGILLYPLVYISLFDSFRGFLLTQNILAANWIFAGVALGAFALLRLCLSAISSYWYQNRTAGKSPVRG
jgi:hypothetical protein